VRNADFIDQLRTAENHLNHGRFAEARALCRQVIARDSTHADAHFLLAMAEDAAGMTASAVTHAQIAAASSPRAEYFAHLGRLLSKLKRSDETLAAVTSAVDLAPTDALTLDTIGNVYSQLGRHDAAVGFFERAIAQKPEQVEFRFNLAASLGFLGRFDEAETHYEEILRTSPLFVKAHAALSALRSQTPARNHIARLRTVLAALPEAQQIHIHYALAKEYEDTSDAENTFSHLATAGAQRKRALGYSFSRDKALFDALRLRFNIAGTRNGHEADGPIFVVGMPRTGTTLVDRILSSHPSVTSASELQTFPLLVKRLARTASSVVLDAETIAGSRNLDPAEMGARYMADSRAHHADAPRFVDKMPLNFFYVGFIAEALPRAKIVCLRRNPMDTCWSNFKNLFATGFSYYNYSYDFLDTAAYYLEFDNLMRHWQRLYPERILEVQYENLVADFLAQAQRLIAHVELPWSDDCLRFHENTAAVATASAAQVRQPLYTHAVARWRRYEQHLAPVAEFFRANGIAIEP